MNYFFILIIILINCFISLFLLSNVDSNPDMVPAFGFINQLSLTENISEFEVSYISVFIL